jgi:50S ribosomal subunit-associated GTPase HflX
LLQLVAAFRATLEEIKDASLLLHVVDVSHPSAAAQIDAVNAVLAELGVENMPVLNVWNKVGTATAACCCWMGRFGRVNPPGCLPWACICQ